MAAPYPDRVGRLRGALTIGAAAFAGAALAGLPPVRDGLDLLTERAMRFRRRPRRIDIARGVRWFEEDRRLALRATPERTERIVRARITALRPRERIVYTEAARRDVRRHTRPPRAAGDVLPGPWDPPSTGSIRIPR